MQVVVVYELEKNKKTDRLFKSFKKQEKLTFIIHGHATFSAFKAQA